MKQSYHLIQGPVQSDYISDLIAKQQDKHNAGAHAVFLGQVRADQLSGKTVTAIEYSAYEPMLKRSMQEISDHLFHTYDDLSFLHITHSKGIVKTGEISLLVLVSCAHRKQAFAAIEDCVEQIKNHLPVWKKELYNDQSHQWLKNNH